MKGEMENRFHTGFIQTPLGLVSNPVGWRSCNKYITKKPRSLRKIGQEWGIWCPREQKIKKTLRRTRDLYTEKGRRGVRKDTFLSPRIRNVTCIISFNSPTTLGEGCSV